MVIMTGQRIRSLIGDNSLYAIPVLDTWDAGFVWLAPSIIVAVAVQAFARITVPNVTCVIQYRAAMAGVQAWWPNAMGAGGTRASTTGLNALTAKT